MTETKILAWHFCAVRDGKPVLRDRSPGAKSGCVETFDGDIEPCVRGLHGSERIIDALQYAPGSWVRHVELSGMILPHGDPVDKHVATRRRILWQYDASRVLRHFAADVAEAALGMVGVQDQRSWDAIEWARAFADGNATVGQLVAAWAAAGDAAWAAAGDAAWDATRAAAWAAAWDAAWDAARDAAWAAAWDAAWGEMNSVLTAMIEEGRP